MGRKIPVTIISGFLGAGKTSAVRHLLENAKGRRLALIVNEFGDVGVDGEILKSCAADVCGPEDIVELTNGCLCCTVADDFLPTLEKLLDRPNPPDHIVIETSGLALPKPLVKAFTWPEIRNRTTVDGVVVMVDGPAVFAGKFADDLEKLNEQRKNDPALDHDNPLEEVFDDQLAVADLVIVNKQDLLNEDQRVAVLEKLKPELRAGIKVIDAKFGRIDTEVLLGLSSKVEDDLANRPTHHEAEGEDHDHDDFESFVIDLPKFQDRADVLTKLKPLLLADSVLRIKGQVVVADKAARFLVQGVGDQIEGYFDRAWENQQLAAGKLVVIGLKGLDQEYLRKLAAS